MIYHSFKKNNSSYWLIAVATILFAACKNNDRVPTNNKIEYTKEAVFPKIEGQNLGIFEQAKDFRMTSDEGEKLLTQTIGLSANQLNFSVNKALQTDNETWFQSAKDPSAQASFNLKNGDFSFNCGMINYLNDNNTLGLLKDSAAAKRAREYLAQLKPSIKNEELVLAHIGGVNKGIHANDKTSIVEKFSTVRFDRQLDNIPVYGHSRIVFNLAQEGRIQTLISQWVPFERKGIEKEALVINPDDLKKSVEKGILTENTQAQKIRVEAIRLVYFDDGSGIIEPALHIKGKTIEGEKDKNQEFPYDVVIPILKSPRLTYSFQHDRLEKRPNESDNNTDGKQIPRSSDDSKKK